MQFRLRRFDLIGVSEVGYFLDADDLATVAQRCDETLGPQGTLIACDWRPAFDGRSLSAERVHGLLGTLGLPRIAYAYYEDSDFLLTVWDRSGCSVAQREGLRPS